MAALIIVRAQVLGAGHPHSTPVHSRNINNSYIIGLLSGLNELLHVKCWKNTWLC